MKAPKILHTFILSVLPYHIVTLNVARRLSDINIFLLFFFFFFFYIYFGHSIKIYKYEGIIEGKYTDLWFRITNTNNKIPIYSETQFIQLKLMQVKL